MKYLKFISRPAMKLNNAPFATGDNIRRLRILKDYKQSTAGRKLGIGQQAYSKIECSAGISEEKALEIIKAFDSSLDEFKMILKFTPPPTHNK